MPAFLVKRRSRVMAAIMYLRINGRRLTVHPTSSEHEIAHAAMAKMVWPKNKAYLEWSDGRVVPVHNDHELQLAARIMEAYLYHEAKDWKLQFQRMEAKVQKHMAEPDSEQDEEVRSDDDMTMDDFYMMGFRHEICN